MRLFEEKVKYLMHNEITELYITNALRAFAFSMINIFIPIFLLTHGFSLIEVGVYALIHYITELLFCFGAVVISSKYGPKHAIGWSIPITILYFLALHSYSSIISIGNYSYLFAIAILGSIATTVYFMGFHIEFSTFTKKPEKQISTINVLGTIAGVLGPLLGSYLLQGFGFSTVFMMVIIILLLAIIPLFFSKDAHKPIEFHPAKIFLNKAKGMIYFAEGVGGKATQFFWPILLFFIFSSFTMMGWMYVVSNILVVLATYFTGRVITQKNERPILNTGSSLLALSLFGRILFTSYPVLIAMQGLGGLSNPLFNIPFKGLFVKRSQRKGIAYFTYFREVYLNLGRISLLILFIILVAFTTPTLALTLCICVSAVAYLAINLSTFPLS